MSESPIGALMLEAQRIASKRSLGTHKAAATCGCEVTVSFFSRDSHSIKPDRCVEHALNPNRHPTRGNDEPDD